VSLAVLANPGLLWLGLAAAAVPIVIHLLSRRRVRRVPWAAMEWLLAAVKRHQRRLRIENWLVLLLRVAALALLGLGLARWVVSDAQLAAVLRPKRSVILLVDTSYSLGAKEGARTVFDRVRDEAERVLSGLGAEDTIAVLASNDPRADRSGLAPAVLLPRTLAKGGVARAKEVVAALRATEAPASWADALTLAVSPGVAPAEDVNRTLYWITDLQARDWRTPEPPAPDPLGKALLAVHRAPAAVRVIDVSAGGRRRNLTLAEVSTPPSETDPFEGRAVSLSAVVWNTGPARVSGAQLRAFVGGALVRTVPLESLPASEGGTLAPGEVRATVELPRSTFARGSAGSHEVRLEVSPPDSDASADLLDLDSERRLALDVRAQVRVAAWTRATAKAKADPRAVLRGVFLGEGTSEYDLRFADGEAALRNLLSDPGWRPDLVVLANTAPAGPDLYRAIVSHVRAGGALVVFVGDNVVASQWNPVAHASPDTRLLPFPFGEREVRTRLEEAWSLDLAKATSHPISKRVAGPDNEWLQRVSPRIFGRMPMLMDSAAPRTMTPRAAEGDDERVVLRFKAAAPGAPAPIAVAEGRLGQGRALWVGTSLDDAWFDGTLFFLPVFLTESALELTRAPDRERNVLVGGRLVAPIAADAAVPTVRVHLDGRGSETPRVRPPETESDLPVVLYDRTGVSGTYRLTYERTGGPAAGAPERVQSLFAVNPDPVEGDLRSATASEVEGRLPGADVRVARTYEDPAASERGATEGELSPYLLLAVFGMLLLELWLAFRFNRRERTAA
jgi:hypothetical protein